VLPYALGPPLSRAKWLFPVFLRPVHVCIAHLHSFAGEGPVAPLITSLGGAKSYDSPETLVLYIKLMHAPLTGGRDPSQKPERPLAELFVSVCVYQ
jgi:hypothetical protein